MAIEKMSLRQRMGNSFRGSMFAVKIGVSVLGGLSLGGCSVKLQGNERFVPSGQMWTEVAKMKLKDICGVDEMVLADPNNIEMVKRAADKLKSANGNVELPDDAFGSFAEGWFGVNVPKGHELVRIPLDICTGIGGTPATPVPCEPAVIDMGLLGNDVVAGIENAKIDIKGDFKVDSPREKVTVEYKECGILIDFEIKDGKLVSILVNSKNALLESEEEIKNGKIFNFVLVDGDKRTLLGAIKVKAPEPQVVAEKPRKKKGSGFRKVTSPPSGIPEPPKAREIKE